MFCGGRTCSKKWRSAAVPNARAIGRRRPLAPPVCAAEQVQALQRGSSDRRTPPAQAAIRYRPSSTIGPAGTVTVVRDEKTGAPVIRAITRGHAAAHNRQHFITQSLPTDSSARHLPAGPSPARSGLGRDPVEVITSNEHRAGTLGQRLGERRLPRRAVTIDRHDAWPPCAAVQPAAASASASSCLRVVIAPSVILVLEITQNTNRKHGNLACKWMRRSRWPGRRR